MKVSRNGFTLIEILVVISILGVVGLAISSMTTTAFKATNSSKIRLDIQDIRRTLTQSLSCRDTFAAYGSVKPIACPSGTAIVLKNKNNSNIVPASGKLAGWDIDARCEDIAGDKGLSIFATKKKPGGGYLSDPLNGNMILDESSPMARIYGAGVRPCSDYFGASTGTPCPPKQSIYMATCVSPRPPPNQHWNHAPFASTPTSGIPLPPFDCRPFGDACLQVYGPSAQVCESFCDTGGTNCKWYAITPAIQICTNDVLPSCSADWYQEVPSRRCTLE